MLKSDQKVFFYEPVNILIHFFMSFQVACSAMLKYSYSFKDF